MLFAKLRTLLDSREISVRELAGAYMDRIEKYNGALNAYIYVDSDGINNAADKAQARIDAGEQAPLTGIPIGLSDNLCTKDMPTTCASYMLDGYRPPFDATVVERLRAQDAVFLGKLNIDEFSMGASTLTSYYGGTKNPYDYTRVPGGASGGAAAAVAAGLCAAAIGVDAGGSVSQPAAYCGVKGFRPTFGYVSRHGCASYASCYDQAGPLAMSSADCSAVLDAVAGYCPKDLTTSVMKDAATGARSADENCIKGLRIGLIGELFGGGADARVLDVVYEAVKWFEKAGAVVSDAGIPMLKHAAAAYHVIACAEASANLARFDGVRYGRRASGNDNSDDAGAFDYFDLVSKSRGEGFGREVKRRILFGTCALGKEYYDRYYMRAVSVADAIDAQYKKALQDFDVLISPAAFTVAPPATAYTAASSAAASTVATPIVDIRGDACVNMADICSYGPSLAGLPSVSTTCGYVTLPVGIMITGRRFDDMNVLKIAGAYEREFVWHAPALSDGWKGY